jgi:Tfp pilus assembly protein PilW
MKKKRGMSLIEVLTGALLMMLICLGTLSLFVSGLTYMTRTSTDLYLGGKNAQSLRWISEYARGAMSATLSNNGNEVDFVVPIYNTTTDPYTGEKELVYPLTTDGLTHGFKVDFTAGTLTDLKSNKVICKNIVAIDPDPKSSTYKSTYVPFSFSIFGSHKLIVMQLITQQKVNGVTRYERMKDTVLLRNT